MSQCTRLLNVTTKSTSRLSLSREGRKVPSVTINDQQFAAVIGLAAPKRYEQAIADG